MLTRGSYNTIVRFWQTHNLLQSKNINDTLWDCSTPSFFFSRVWKGWEMDQKIWRPKHNMFHHWPKVGVAKKIRFSSKTSRKVRSIPPVNFCEKLVTWFSSWNDLRITKAITICVSNWDFAKSTKPHSGWS